MLIADHVPGESAQGQCGMMNIVTDLNLDFQAISSAQEDPRSSIKVEHEIKSRPSDLVARYQSPTIDVQEYCLPLQACPRDRLV